MSTWNVGGIAPEEGLNMEDLLETCSKSFDIYVLGYCSSHPLHDFHHRVEILLIKSDDESY